MTCRSFWGAVLVSVLSGVAVTQENLGASPQQESVPRPDFHQLLEKIASFSPDPCDSPDEVNQESADIESSAFDRAADAITKSLNAGGASQSSAMERATEALTRLRRMSAEINASWPEENRFQSEILDLPPVLVVKMGLRSHETFFVFGRSEGKSGNLSQDWHSESSAEGMIDHNVLHSGLGLYPLFRGPSQHARFLASFGYMGCAGGAWGLYSAHEWSPRLGHLELIVKQAGSFGLDDKVPGFPQIGKLQTKGTLIALPYCWFSSIDTWDNPSLCAVDSYDVSGDNVRFRSHTYNRPDLVPVAKVLEFAEQRDYRAVLGYCALGDVARRLVRDIPPYVFADDLRVSITGANKERVELGFEPTYRFDVEMLAGRWQVVGFSAH
ncbi:MAG TPA: hypothetical protein VHW24_00320 [Bryobacteraceae bacterium]|nr:hypothetical protein [Bryobacteraceae bacterium]